MPSMTLLTLRLDRVEQLPLAGGGALLQLLGALLELLLLALEVLPLGGALRWGSASPTAARSRDAAESRLACSFCTSPR